MIIGQWKLDLYVQANLGVVYVNRWTEVGDACVVCGDYFGIIIFGNAKGLWM